MRKTTWWDEFKRGARLPEQQRIVDLEAEVERVRAEAKDWQDLNAEHWAEYWRLRAALENQLTHCPQCGLRLRPEPSTAPVNTLEEA
jgi:2-polyprenyl-6-methoxyphenol hydroxylase-like FAD-dependent oxidoreductase